MCPLDTSLAFFPGFRIAISLKLTSIYNDAQAFKPIPVERSLDRIGTY